MRLRPLSLADIARRRANAARDADLLASGWQPDAATLADAPFIDDFVETVWPGTALPVLYGRVSGHPRLLPGPCMTTPILARGDGWMRTEGRWYRTGAPRAVPPASPIEELVQAWAGHDPDAVVAAVAAWRPPPGDDDETPSSGFVGF